MGVIHKLKSEIVDFILQKKQENPSLSCRSLAAIVQDAFEQKVSKSSINNVLKDASLSSPVGRRWQSKKSKIKTAKKKFELPVQKKQEIFSDVSQHCILSDLNQDEGEGEIIDGVGCIFLKAAEWELSRQPILEGTLKEYCPGGNEQKIVSVAALLGFLKAFHIESLEGLSRYEGKGLWKLNGIETRLLESDVLNVLECLKDRQEFFLKFSLKVPQIFTQAAGLRFVLKDGSTFFIDGQTASLWKNTQKGFSVSLAKATDMLAKVLNNVQSVVLCSISPKNAGKTQETRQISDFFKAFENVQSKKIQKIELLGEDDQILGDFDGIPQIRRSFIAGVWPWEIIFQKFLEAKKIFGQGKVSRGGASQDLEYKDVSIRWSFEGRQFSVRGILLFEPFMQIPFLVLITNMDPQELSPKDIIVQYCQRWPNMEKGSCFSVLSDPVQWKGSFSTERKPFLDLLLNETLYGRDPVWLAIDQMLSLLDRFSRRQFFSETYEGVDFHTMQHRFYGLSGRLMCGSHHFIAEVKVPDASPYIRDLLFASQRVNESGVTTFDGKPVSIRII